MFNGVREKDVGDNTIMLRRRRCACVRKEENQGRDPERPNKIRA